MPRLSALALSLCTLGLLAQAPAKAEKKPEKPKFEFGVPDKPFTSDVSKLMKEVADHQQAVSNLEEMSDSIGPRLTGSDHLRKAQAWAMDKLKSYGAVNVHEEAWDFGPSWTRGRDWARLTNCNGTDLSIAGMAWGPATKGVVKGGVILAEAKTMDELKALVPSLNGKIVMWGKTPKPPEGQDRMAFYREMMGILREAKPAAVLRSSGRENGLLNMTGSPVSQWGKATVPTAFLSGEHANLLTRLIKRGQHPEIEIQIAGETSKDPVKCFNVVAEIKGSQWPDQIVIVGGHQDSWDLGTGATDNGTGTVVAMETLRAIKAFGVQPKRTIRVILFSGEEEGLLGSEAYVKAHMDEMKDIQAVLVDDMGTGQIQGWPDMDQEQWRGYLAQAMAPANNIGCNEIGAFVQPGDTDHWPFYQQGVPAFAAIQDPVDYMTITHHSQADTFDHVVADDLVQGAQSMAATAWMFANMTERVPHITPTAKPEDKKDEKKAAH
ncbi:MAG TPA: M20/M25/M40 family metallo-hydrolase [Holophagaceae bacterium]|jgi:carboxypeptidase Q|nr:M20/M25/M40 family metallo-hydrolase [Holophagaceae bacterium]